MNGLHELHIDVGCYVVDALDPDEREAFEAHLAGCESCGREVLEFTETAAELARLVAMGPPRTVRGTMLATIQSVRPLPPLLDDIRTVVRPVSPAAESADATAPIDSTDLPTDELAARRARTGSRRQRVLIALVAAAAVLAVASGGLVVNLTQQHQANVAAQAAAQRENELLAAPDARVLTQSRDGARYTFIVSRQRNQALLIPNNLPDPGAGKVYQLWTLQGRRATPDATMAAGSRSQWFTGPIAGSTTLAVTVEPEGGSRTPTQPILAQVSI